MRRCSVCSPTIAAAIGWSTGGVFGSGSGQVVQTVHRPHGIRYSFTLHDTDGTRLLGFDNAHGVSRALPHDHRHRFGDQRSVRCDAVAILELRAARRVPLISRISIRRVQTMTRKSLAELREEMRGVARGERTPAPLPAAPLLASLTPEAIELMGTLLREHPKNVRELAALTGRVQPNISRSLQLLARHGLVRLVRDGTRRAAGTHRHRGQGGFRNRHLRDQGSCRLIGEFVSSETRIRPQPVRVTTIRTIIGRVRENQAAIQD